MQTPQSNPFVFHALWGCLGGKETELLLPLKCPELGHKVPHPVIWKPCCPQKKDGNGGRGGSLATRSVAGCHNFDPGPKLVFKDGRTGGSPTSFVLHPHFHLTLQSPQGVGHPQDFIALAPKPPFLVSLQMKLTEFSQATSEWPALGSPTFPLTQTPLLGAGSGFSLPLGPLLLVLWFSGLTPVSPASRDSPLH